MNRKILLTTLSIITMINFTSIFANNTPKDENTKEKKSKLQQKHFFIELGSNYENFQLPKFGVASSGLSGKQDSLITINSNKKMVTPQIKLGINFNNTFLANIFGNQASIYMNAEGFNTDSSTNNFMGVSSNWPTAYFWKIDGSGNFFPAPSPAKAEFKNVKLSTNTKYRNFGIYFKGKQKLSTYTFSKPKIGIVYTSLKQNYNVSMEVAVGQGPNFKPATIDESINTDYYGVSGGETIEHYLTPKLSFLININLELLYAISNLTVDQQPTSGNFHISLTNSKKIFTYRSKATVGLNYAFTQSSISPSLRFAVGVDQWGYVPGVHNPKGYGDTQAAHIVGYSYWNPFANVSFRVPF